MNQSQNVIEFINPATGEKFGQTPIATEQEVLVARRELAALAPMWAAKPVKERVRILRRLQEVLIDSVDEITAVINLDHGKSRQDGWIEVMMTVDKLHQYLKRAPAWLGKRNVPRGLYFFRNYYTEPRPFGVVGVIGPWNYPFELVVPAVYSALLAGNAVLVKPSEVAAATGVMIETLFNRVPDLAPYVRFLHGDAATGEALVNARPDLVFLTGSTQTGRAVARSTAETMTPFLCELGGKDAMIVLEDADIAAAARWGVWGGAAFNAGQSCVAVERIYVVEDVYDAFVEFAVREAKKVRMGYTPDIDSPFEMGPLTFERQVEIIEDHLQDALQKGARVLYGGRREEMFMEPTILVEVDHSMKIMLEETFGPIIPIMKVRDEEHAVQLANHSEFGLDAYVWTKDLRRAERIGGRLDVGTVNINDVLVNYPVSLLPFGGTKMSGNARTHGREEVLQFTRSHSYAVGRPPSPLDIATILRSPGNYRLGSAVMHLAFGVTPGQRLRPLRQMAEEKQLVPTAGKAAVAAGVATAAAVLAFSLVRRR